MQKFCAKFLQGANCKNIVAKMNIWCARKVVTYGYMFRGLDSKKKFVAQSQICSNMLTFKYRVYNHFEIGKRKLI